MAKRLVEAFSGPKKPCFVAYTTAGFPTVETTVPALVAMQEAGVGVIEVGVPFSDPLADGGTIQKANEVALANGVSLRQVLGMVKEARAAGVTVPIVLMGYYNPILSYGEAALAKDAAAAGVDGFIVVDLPPEDAMSFVSACDSQGLGYIPLVAPTSTDARLVSIGAVARGFLYCVSVTGVTGARSSLPPDLSLFLQRLRATVPPAVPLAVGFGLSTREHVAEVAALGADGVVMGSAIVRALEAGGVPAMKAFLAGVLWQVAGGRWAVGARGRLEYGSAGVDIRIQSCPVSARGTAGRNAVGLGSCNGFIMAMTVYHVMRSHIRRSYM